MQPVHRIAQGGLTQDDPTIRRTLPADLVRLQELLATEEGSLGLRLRDWRDRFHAATRSLDLEVVVTHYANDLQRSLQPLSVLTPGLREVAACLQRYNSCPPVLLEALGDPSFLLQDLQTIGELLASSTATDDMMTGIRSWHASFLQDLERFDVATVAPRYIENLQQQLIDAVTQQPLDTPVYLGSDGFTYGQMSISMHALVGPHIENRSFFDLDQEGAPPFQAERHDPVVEHMVQWLRQRGAYQEPSSRVQFFEDLRRLLGIQEMGLEEQQEQRQRLQGQERAEQEGETAAEEHLEEFDEYLQTIAAEVEGESAAEGDALVARLESDAQRQQQQIAAIRQQDVEGLAALATRRQEASLHIEQLGAAIEALRTQVDEVDEQLTEVTAQIGGLNADMGLVRQQHAAQQQRRQELFEQTQELQRHDEDLRQQRQALQQQIDELAQQAQGAEEAAQQLQADVDRIQEQAARIRQQQGELRQAQADLDLQQTQHQETLDDLQRVQADLYQRELLLIHKKSELVEAKRRAESRKSFLSSLVAGIALVAVAAILAYATGGTSLLTSATVSGGSGAQGVTGIFSIGVAL